MIIIKEYPCQWRDICPTINIRISSLKKFANLVNYNHKTSEFLLETEDFKKE